MKTTEMDYKLPFFVENDFIRKKCKICGCNFWTQNRDAENCGDAPCQPYTFLGNSPTKHSFTLDEMREAFISFFENNGHTRIKPYPVVARWRDDLFVTIASIADFQPFVTEGIIPPPANPLVISQPCLRFTDVDNVGLTAGRHGTIFEMGGAHAFNYPDKEIYWKDRTVSLHHQFVTDVLGVKSDLVTYKEGVWVGGGNAGLDLEGCISGLEVSTLVFMQYKVIGERFVEMPIKIVDTGYGIERFTWLSQGTPSAFHCVYGQLLDKVLSFAGLSKVNLKILVESARYSALMNVETTSDKTALRRIVANKLGMDALQLEQVMAPIEAVYAVVDHTKALTFLLAEGVVPSNVRVGYLTRLLLRRTYRLLKQLNIEERLSEIIELQIKQWSPSFPNINEMRGEILEAVSVEEKKYKETLERGVELSRKIASQLKAEGQKEMPIMKLVELYDSHGISPEIVRDTIKSDELKVVIPDNFYGMIAERHSSSQALSEGKSSLSIIEQEVAGLPPTIQLYYDDAYANQFNARVLRVIEGKYVVLDKTLFYPKSGGQDSDTGFIEIDSRRLKVLDVFKLGNIIVHVIEEASSLAGGSDVAGEIDWNRRINLMRHHTSTHIILGAMRRVIGQHVWQAGAEKEAERSRLDVSHWERLSSEQLIEIESLANELVLKDIPVKVSQMDRGEAESRYGYRLYQGGIVPGGKIRVVKIGEWDVEACGGTHVKSTGEVGLIKIIRTDRIQDGVERIIFASGTNAVKHVQRLEGDLKKISNLLNTSLEKTVDAVNETQSEIKELKGEIERFKEMQMKFEVEDMFSKARMVDGVILATRSVNNIDIESMIKVSNSLTKKDSRMVIVICGVAESARLVVMAGEVAIRKGVDAGKIAAKLSTILGGGGGGRPNLGQGGGTYIVKIDEALSEVESIIKSQLEENNLVS